MAKKEPIQHEDPAGLYGIKRLPTRIVNMGGLSLGGDFPLRVQSMTNTPTADILATAAQARSLFEAGCDYVRITARNVSEARALARIKNQLHTDGFTNPLIADIHFNPEVALTAARLVEKVRINPGNYVDTSDLATDWNKATAELHEAALEKIAVRLKPLADVCREYGCAIRVGTNHGSLSRRILAKWGNTAEGMVQSALEFISVFASLGFHDLVLSMKSSDIRVMVQAYRLLAHRMQEQGFDYPLHLGLTEAGAGEDGIIKSAAAIGVLLTEGLGDTIRVSLTGDPLAEVPVARRLADVFEKKPSSHLHAPGQATPPPFAYSRRQTHAVATFGGGNQVQAIINGKSESGSADVVFCTEIPNLGDKVLLQKIILPYEQWEEGHNGMFPYFREPEIFSKADTTSARLNFVLVSGAKDLPVIIESFLTTKNMVAVIPCDAEHPPVSVRRMIQQLSEATCDIPIVLKSPFTHDQSSVDCAAYLSALLVDGYGDAVWIDNNAPENAVAAEEFAFNLLQAHGLRRTRAEFVSCPTCGRSTYNVEAVLKKVRDGASHIKHLKIGVMGCIVNGPGEMAGADYGCVGSAPGRVHIYKGETIICRNIPEDEAAAEIIRLMQSDLQNPPL